MTHDARYWERLTGLLHEILARTDAADRAAFLDEVFKDDPSLRVHLKYLVRAAERLEAQVEGSARDLLHPTLIRHLCEEVEETDEPATLETMGRHLGPYVLLCELGRGGMGTVYLAQPPKEEDEKEEPEPLALKVLRRGLDTEDILRRFRQEHALLERLDHPGIAEYIDNGVSEDGRPYYAMEYVEGEALTHFCRRRHLGLNARLDLVKQICDALGFAHASLVVHRDLKPANVLVAEEEDGTPRPKLLDFGVAKVLAPDDRAMGMTLPLTGATTQLLTPGYAAPEQTSGQPVSVATDIYALGAMLYELLTGRRPERAGSVVKPPSEIISEEHAAQMAESIDDLRHRYRDDLDAIVLTALRDEPKRRYASVDALKDDINRYQKHMPVRARRDSFAYRAQKFARRHRTALASLALMLLLSIGFGAYHMASLTEARERAETEAMHAREAAQRAESIRNFVVGLFENIRPKARAATSVTAVELLDAGTRRVQQQLQNQPSVKADILITAASLYEAFGDYGRAVGLARQSIALHRKAGRADMNAYGELAFYLRRLGRLEEADSVIVRAMEEYRERRSEYRDTTWAGLLYSRSISQRRLGNLNKAETLARSAVRLQRDAAPEDTARYSVYLGGLSRVLEAQGRLDESLTAKREAYLLTLQEFGQNHQKTAMRLHNLGKLLGKMKRPEDGLPLLMEADHIWHSLYGSSHPHIATNYISLARLLTALDRNDEAERYLQEGLIMLENELAPDHPDLLDARQFETYYFSRNASRTS